MKLWLCQHLPILKWAYSRGWRDAMSQEHPPENNWGQESQRQYNESGGPFGG